MQHYTNAVRLIQITCLPSRGLRQHLPYTQCHPEPESSDKLHASCTNQIHLTAFCPTCIDSGYLWDSSGRSPGSRAQAQGPDPKLPRSAHRARVHSIFNFRSPVQTMLDAPQELAHRRTAIRPFHQTIPSFISSPGVSLGTSVSVPLSRQTIARTDERPLQVKHKPRGCPRARGAASGARPSWVAVPEQAVGFHDVPVLCLTTGLEA
jgi:hypothetical protein